MKPEIERLFRAKDARRIKLATLAIVRMQQMAAPILRARGKPVRVWRLPQSESA